MSTTYEIKTPIFQGPFGLLLDLVEKRKLFINDLSLASVTDDYLRYVSELSRLGEKLNHSEVSSFIAVAATLILIKSKSLLPNLSLSGEEESDIKNLEERLRLYQEFCRLADHVKSKFGQKIIFPPAERRREVLIFLPDDRITRESMMAFASRALGALPQPVKLPEVEVKKVISIEEMLEKLTERVKKAVRFNFKDFRGKEKVEVIIGFLAMLELMRQGILNATQESNEHDIIIEKLAPRA